MFAGELETERGGVSRRVDGATAVSGMGVGAGDALTGSEVAATWTTGLPVEKG